MLPIEQIRSEVLEAVSQPGFCVLLSAPTGSGKSTRIPGMLLEAGWGEKGTIIAGWRRVCWPATWRGSSPAS